MGRDGWSQTLHFPLWCKLSVALFYAAAFLDGPTKGLASYGLRRKPVNSQDISKPQFPK